MRSSLKKSNFLFYQNSIHINADENILKAVELCDTPWVYLLGDSKIPNKNVLKELENDCLLHKDAASIVYKHKNKILKGKYINSLDDIKDDEINISDFFLIGNSIISRFTIQSYLNVCSSFTKSNMAIIIFHIMSLVENKKIFISEKKLIEKFVSKPKHYDPHLSLINCWYSFALILNLPISLFS